MGWSLERTAPNLRTQTRGGKKAQAAGEAMIGVYFVRHDAILKVGSSSAIRDRFTSLGLIVNGEPIGVQCCDTYAEARKLELAWLRRLKPYPAHGREWFKVSDELLDLIRSETMSPEILKQKAIYPQPDTVDAAARELVKMRWDKTS